MELPARQARAPRATYNSSLPRRVARLIGRGVAQQPYRASLALLLLIGLSAALLYLGYLVLVIPSRLVGFLVDKETHGFWRTVAEGAAVMCAYILLQAASDWLIESMALIWRVRLSTQGIAAFTHGSTLADVAAKGVLDTPDQRLVSDPMLLTQLAASLLQDVLTAPATVIFYTVKTAQALGWMAPVCIYAYFLVGALVNRTILSPIIRLVYRLDAAQGRYRRSTVRAMAAGESVVLQGGSGREQSRLLALFGAVVGLKRSIINRHFVLSLLTNFSAYSTSIAVYMLVSIPVFAGVSLGKSPGQVAASISLAVSLCISLMGGFTSFLNASKTFGDFCGYAMRVETMFEALEAQASSAGDGHEDKDSQAAKTIVANGLEYSAPLGASAAPLVTVETDVGPLQDEAARFVVGDAVQLDDVTLVTPTGRVLLEHISFAVPDGCPTLIVGPSGCGKTSIVRMLAGLWRASAGRVSRPSSITFLSQHAYAFPGSLAENVSYPSPPAAGAEARIRSALCDVHLEHLLDHADGNEDDELHADDDWPSRLSGGEQQRLALARVFYHRPRFAVLDESVSAIDLATVDGIFDALRAAGVTPITISHNRSLEKYHTEVVDVSQFLPRRPESV